MSRVWRDIYTGSTILGAVEDIQIIIDHHALCLFRQPRSRTNHKELDANVENLAGSAADN